MQTPQAHLIGQYQDHHDADEQKQAKPAGNGVRYDKAGHQQYHTGGDDQRTGAQLFQTQAAQDGDNAADHGNGHGNISRDNTRQFLKDHPEIAAEIEEALRREMTQNPVPAVDADDIPEMDPNMEMDDEA